MNISPARIAAYEVLLRIETERAFSSVLLPLFEKGLSAPDAALCHELTLGTLRNQILIDRMLSFHIGEKKLDVEVRIALRLGTYQLVFLDRIPAYSAINDSVSLVQRAKKTSAKGLVNAVLRKMTSKLPEIEFSDEIDRIATVNSHPRWLIEKWIKEFGIIETKSLAEANNTPSRLTFRLTGKASTRAWGAAEACSRSEYVEGCFFANGDSTELRQLSALGEIYFQDEGSQMAAAAVRITNSERFLDVCAAPGSKTTMIGNRALDCDLLIAGDVYDQRIRFLRDNCIAQGLVDVKIVQYDATKYLPFAEQSFGSVLVDTPCSGTGTIRRNPEIRYNLSDMDFEQFQTKQLQMLKNASKMVKSGGTLVYSTCSLEREENEDVCSMFLSGDPGFSIDEPSVPERFVNADGFASTYPHRDNMDGFFIAGFRRMD
ncbi:MAG: 16S rRNA (cytosine(967)-C(5))-methyltransferase RsmB [Pyrinomonadaceae bacterium]